MNTRLLPALVLAAGLTFAGCGGDEPQTPAETVTVTAPDAPAVSDSSTAAEVFTARGLIDLAGAAGLPVCSNPENVGNADDRALETVACFALTDREQIYYVFANERDQKREVAELREIASYNANLGDDGYVTASALAGVAGDGTAWVITAPVADLRPIAEQLDAELFDFSDLRTEAPEPTKPPKPAGPPTSFGEGTYLVGEDVAAGLYRSGGPSPDDGRYCVVFASEKPDDLNSYLRGSTIQGPTVIELNAGEWVTSQFCETFKRS